MGTRTIEEAGVEKRLNTIRDAEELVARNVADKAWVEESTDELRKARLFASDVLQQARENRIDGGTIVGASAYIMAAAIASTTPNNHMSDEVRDLVTDRAVSLMTWALREMRLHMEEAGF